MYWLMDQILLNIPKYCFLVWRNRVEYMYIATDQVVLRSNPWKYVMLCWLISVNKLS